jgi:hypothetical protein
MCWKIHWVNYGCKNWRPKIKNKIKWHILISTFQQVQTPTTLTKRPRTSTSAASESAHLLSQNTSVVLAQTL